MQVLMHNRGKNIEQILYHIIYTYSSSEHEIL